MPVREDRHEPCGERPVSLVHDRGFHPPALPTYAGINMVCRLCRRSEERYGCRLPPTSSRPLSMSPQCPIQQSANLVDCERNQCLMLDTAGHENDLSQGRSSAEWRRWHKDCSERCGQRQSRGDAGGSQSSNQTVSASLRPTDADRLAQGSCITAYGSSAGAFAPPLQATSKVCRPLIKLFVS